LHAGSGPVERSGQSRTPPSYLLERLPLGLPFGAARRVLAADFLATLRTDFLGSAFLVNVLPAAGSALHLGAAGFFRAFDAAVSLVCAVCG
jgi:hypothetical protein